MKYFIIDIWQYYEYPLDSKYARVQNMLGLYTWFWLKFSVIDIWQGSVYDLSSEYVSVTQGFCRKRNIIYICQSFEYSSDSYNARSWIYKGYNMPRLHRVLRELYFKDPQLFWMSWVLKMLRFWIYQESLYSIVTKGSEWNTSSYIFDRVLNITRFKFFKKKMLEGVLNMPGF